MEITIFASLDDRYTGKELAKMLVPYPVNFSLNKPIDFFRSIYGSDIVIEFSNV